LTLERGCHLSHTPERQSPKLSFGHLRRSRKIAPDATAGHLQEAKAQQPAERKVYFVHPNTKLIRNPPAISLKLGRAAEAQNLPMGAIGNDAHRFRSPVTKLLVPAVVAFLADVGRHKVCGGLLAIDA